MIIACASCGSKYKYDENKLQGAQSKKLKCPKCQAIIEIVHPLVAATKVQTKPSAYDAAMAMEQTYQTSPSGLKVPVIRPAADASEAHMQEDMNGPSTAQVKRDTLLSEVAQHAQAQESLLKLPEYRRYSLAVIQGYNAGEIFQINKPRMIVGRMEADIVVKDLEASRQHARLDVVGDRVILRDLNSTNGTFVNEQRITTMTLDNQQEFRIGTTVFMLIITDLE